MKHLGVLKNSLKRVRAFQIELEFGDVSFLEEKTGIPGEIRQGARERCNYILNPDIV